MMQSFVNQIVAEKEFDDLCFEFGIELDEVVCEYYFLKHKNWVLILQTTERQIKDKEQGINRQIEENEEVIYRIEIPANR